MFVDTATWAKTEMPGWISEGLRRFVVLDAEGASS